MHEAIARDDLRVFVAEKRERNRELALEPRRVLLRVGADRQNLDAGVLELSGMARQTGKLGSAEGSPEAAIEDEQRRVATKL